MKFVDWPSSDKKYYVIACGGFTFRSDGVYFGAAPTSVRTMLSTHGTWWKIDQPASDYTGMIILNT